MRDFSQTGEPSGKDAKVVPSKALRFVIQKHAASHLHFDLRLEYEGTFRSWAVPKAPSLDPKDRRMAMEVEDHPLDYGDFEGTIPKGQYGGGTVMLWDRGYWAPEKGFENIGQALAKGELKFVMEGERMHGSWVIVRLKGDKPGKPKNAWLLIKHRDEGAVEGNTTGPTDDDKSIASGRTMTEITNGKGRAAKPFMTAKGADAGAVWQSNRDDSAPAGLHVPSKGKGFRRQGQDRFGPAELRRTAAGEAPREAALRAQAGRTRSSSTAIGCSCAPLAARRRCSAARAWTGRPSFPEIVAGRRQAWRRHHRWRGRGAGPHRRARLRGPAGRHLRRQDQGPGVLRLRPDV